MYTLDAGLISIIATIAAIILGVYSAIDSRQKKGKGARRESYGSERVDNFDLNEDEKNGEASGGEAKIFNNPFDEIFDFMISNEEEQRRERGVDVEQEHWEEGEMYAEEGGDTESEYHEEKYYGEENKQFNDDVVSTRHSSGSISESIALANESNYDNGLDSVENTVFAYEDDSSMGDEITSIENERAKEETYLEGAKKRIKSNPKDLVIFSEILKPKYQDF